jgi:proteasome accessory factor C
MRESADTAEVRDAVQRAVLRRRALRIRYYTASRDEITERVVDPMRLLLVEGRSYLEAWCRSADGVRLFRLDRIDEVTELDEPAAPPAHARPTDTSDGLFRPEANQSAAWLVLRPDARWVSEYYPVDQVQELPDGRTRVLMRYADQSWMVRLLLGLGDEVVVESPPELAGAIADRAREALRRAEHLHSA